MESDVAKDAALKRAVVVPLWADADDAMMLKVGEAQHVLVHRLGMHTMPCGDPAAAEPSCSTEQAVCRQRRIRKDEVAMAGQIMLNVPHHCRARWRQAEIDPAHDTAEGAEGLDLHAEVLPTSRAPPWAALHFNTLVGSMLPPPISSRRRSHGLH